MALDLNESYKEVQRKIEANKSYSNAKSRYDEVTKNVGSSFESKKSDITSQLNEAKQQLNGYSKDAKTQFDQLLDISKITGGKGANTIKYLKKTFIKVLRIIGPEIDSIVINEIANALGCDQQQIYDSTTAIYIKVASIDLRGILKLDPDTRAARSFYERRPITIQDRPFSLNRELYARIQSGQPYSVDNGQLYLGASGQPLFDIQFFDIHPITGVPGGWYKITLQNRVNGVNKVIEFLKDYYTTIRIFDIISVFAGIIDAITGAISIEADFGINRNGDATVFSLYIQRILGLCFDNAKEIDVSGISKLSELDDIDDSFFQLTDLDLRKIDNKVSDIQNRVVEFEDCDNVKLPVDSVAIVNAINNLYLIESEIDLDASINNLTNVIASNPAWAGFGFDFTAQVKASIDLNFIKLLVNGLIGAILTPKVLLPLITMFKAIKLNGLSGIITDSIAKYEDFLKQFKKLIVGIVSKIGGLFVRELFLIIKKDLFNLLQQIIKDIAKEKGDKRIIIVLKLTQLLIVVIQFIRDWRRCKSVVDELLKLLTIATTGFGLDIPSPLLALSQFLDGYSAIRAFIGTVEEMQKMGIPTGDMPDGSPNLDLLGKFGQIRAQANEMAENSKVQSIASPSKVFPNGTTGAAKVTGKLI